MSATMIATCWNHRSLLRESAGQRPAARREELHQLDVLAAEPQALDAHTRTEHAVQVLMGIADALRDRPTRSNSSTSR